MSDPTREPGLDAATICTCLHDTVILPHMKGCPDRERIYAPPVSPERGWTAEDILDQMKMHAQGSIEYAALQLMLHIRKRQADLLAAAPAKEK